MRITRLSALLCCAAVLVNASTSLATTHNTVRQSLNQAQGQDQPLNEIYQYADALNIEGGTVWQRLNPNQKWVNICYILDRPLLNGVDLAQITKKNEYPLKESSIEEYNEPQVNYNTATILHYYIQNAHQIAKRPKEETTNIVVQVHRDTSGNKHFKLIEKLLLEGYPDDENQKIPPFKKAHNSLATYYYPKYNTQIDFRKGARDDSLNGFENADIVISVSLAAGLNPSLQSGMMVVPRAFIPMNLEHNKVRTDQTYFAQNHLFEALDDIVKTQSENTLAIMNDKFKSLNPSKHHLKAKKLKTSDFRPITVLQVSKIFNPNGMTQKTFSVCCSA